MSARGGASDVEAGPEVGCCEVAAQAVTIPNAAIFKARENHTSQQVII